MGARGPRARLASSGAQRKAERLSLRTDSWMEAPLGGARLFPRPTYQS
jgi:hypothetical protein